MVGASRNPREKKIGKTEKQPMSHFFKKLALGVRFV
jgi:hypothetical protein